MCANEQRDRFGWFWFFGISAFLVLGAAALWLGGLNQDEGWYLYAAQLVGEGKVPYRDFFYTQGPLLPLVYSAFAWTWKAGGLLGGRLLTLVLGTVSLGFAVALVRRLVPADRRAAAGVSCLLLLGCNLYHLYYLTIPKTYALASVFVLMGLFLLVVASEGRRYLAGLAGLALAFAAGTRISLGALLVVAGLHLLLSRQRRMLVWFCLGGFFGLALVYGPFLCDAGAREGLLAAQRYHAARGGFDPIWVVGSVSRLVRWYLPVFVLLGLRALSHRTVSKAACADAPHDGESCRDRLRFLPFWGFLAVFAVQMVAPFPYEDYQVPVMGLLAVFAVAWLLSGTTDLRRMKQVALLALGMTWAGSFGSPLLERWMTNGQDRFWSLKKPQCELAQLRSVARQIESLDPGGQELLTQDLYLAIECRRKVPQGLEMGPFAMMPDADWRKLLGSAPCEIAALSGYSFAIVPPVCDERPIGQQMEFWNLLKNRYRLVDRVENFGQNATTLMILRRK